MSQSETDARRIAHNTLMLYLRMLISVVVGLYTSRVVLQTLGVEDYGIYGLVGGIVSMLGFLNASMSSATSRFITYALGVGNLDKLSQTFNASFQSHLIIALIVVVFAETIGLWILSHQLVLPQSRMSAALWVYQLSVFSSFIGITQVPYSAVVLAHEQMDIYAWLEVLNVILKLFIVFLLQLLGGDKMIIYGILSLAISFLIQFLYRLYCHFNFEETHLSFHWETNVVRQMLSFSGWTLYADGSVTIRQQGVIILINRFFGVVLNAACSVASIVQGTVWTCGYYVLAAFRPQIIKQFANKNYLEMQVIMSNSLKYTMLLFLLVSVPAILCMPTLIRIWLGTVPPFTIVICQILLIDNLFGLINHTFTIGIQAQGNIKGFSLLNGTLKLLCLPSIFLLLKNTPHPAIPFLFNVLVLLLITFVNFEILKNKIPQLNCFDLLCPLCKTLLLGIISFFLILPFHFYLKDGLLHLSTISFLYFCFLALGTFCFLIDQDTRVRVIQKLPWNHK